MTVSGIVSFLPHLAIYPTFLNIFVFLGNNKNRLQYAMIYILSIAYCKWKMYTAVNTTHWVALSTSSFQTAIRGIL